MVMGLVQHEKESSSYRIFLEAVLPELLQDVSNSISKRLWFQHDGATGNFSTVLCSYVDTTFGRDGLGVMM